MNNGFSAVTLHSSKRKGHKEDAKIRGEEIFANVSLGIKLLIVKESPMKPLITLLALFLMSGSVHAEKTLFYKVYKEKAGVPPTEMSIHIGNLASDRILAQWKGKANGDKVEHVLSSDYAVRSWNVSDPKRETEYVGERKGDHLLIKGRNRGKEIDKRINIDGHPFFFHPALGLSEFVRSGEKSQEFWTLRPDNLSEYKMKAENQGTETIVVNGEQIETMRVKWGLTGMLSSFFSQTFWFRKSDGVFVKSKVARGMFTELVNEQ